MKTGISFQGFIPIRQEPSESSEMVSQVLFGETFEVRESRGAWRLISLDFDGTEGWVGSESIHSLAEADGAEKGSAGAPEIVVHPVVELTDRIHSRKLMLPAGSLLHGQPGKGYTIQGIQFECSPEGGIVIPGSSADPEKISKALLSIPRLHGGRSGFGFDAPGLIQFLCRVMGISIPRHCREQAGLGSAINFLHEVRKGDLAFFDNPDGVINHVGMVVGKSSVVHVYDRVRIDKLDQQGIFSTERAGYTHRLRIIKRIENQG
jgi:hypothetical protein